MNCKNNNNDNNKRYNYIKILKTISKIEIAIINIKIYNNIHAIQYNKKINQIYFF